MRKWLSVPVLTLALVALVASGSSAGPGSYTLGIVNGMYAFSFDGAFVDGTRVAAVGEFSADGHGNILNGVRTLSVGYSTGAVVISNNEVHLIGTDASSVVHGLARRQG